MDKGDIICIHEAVPSEKHFRAVDSQEHPKKKAKQKHGNVEKLSSEHLSKTAGESVPTPVSTTTRTLVGAIKSSVPQPHSSDGVIANRKTALNNVGEAPQVNKSLSGSRTKNPLTSKDACKGIKRRPNKQLLVAPAACDTSDGSHGRLTLHDTISHGLLAETKDQKAHQTRQDPQGRVPAVFRVLKKTKNGKVLPSADPLQTPYCTSDDRFALMMSTPNTEQDLTRNLVAHIRSHFLNRLFLNLNAHRQSSIISAPFLTPVSITYSAHATSPTFDLAFQGIHPNLYAAKSTENFVVAMRFWLWRFHTSLQLGSGGMRTTEAQGSLVPDMTFWPAVVECRQICYDIWFVKTEASLTQPRPNSKDASRAVTAQTSSNLVQITKFVILGSNGEVLGRSREPTSNEAPQSETKPANTIEGCQVRSDWYDFIRAGSVGTPADSSSRRLTKLIRTKDAQSFPGGISKTWQERKREAGEFEALHVAERTALSGCVLER